MMVEGGVELGGQQYGHADGARADNSHRIARLDIPILDADFVAGGQDVAQQDGDFVVNCLGDLVEAVVGMRDADVFGLHAIDHVTQDPPAVAAMGVKLLLAVVARAARSDAGNQDLVAFLELRDTLAHFLDDAYPFMAQDAPVGDLWILAFVDAEIRAADRGLQNPYYYIRGLLKGGLGLVFKRDLVVTVINQSFHVCIPLLKKP